MILWVIGSLAGLIVVALAGLYLWGSSLPIDHTATAGADLSSPPDAVFRRISDVAGYQQWRTGLKSIRVESPERWIEESANGRIPFRVLETHAPVRRVVRIDSEDLPFGGTWTYALKPTSTGTRVEITEQGQVKSPLFRAMSRLFFPADKTMKAFLADLKRAL